MSRGGFPSGSSAHIEGCPGGRDRRGRPALLTAPPTALPAPPAAVPAALPALLTAPPTAAAAPPATSLVDPAAPAIGLRVVLEALPVELPAALLPAGFLDRRPC